jgi:DNA-binding NarL/FixJ family response regulator
VGAVVIRVLLADDHHLIRAGIRGLLELTPDLSVVGEAADGEETTELLVTLRPDVAVLDVRMPKCSGIEALARARARGVAPPTILLTTFDDDAALREGVAAGIAGFLLKDVSLDELALAIRKVAAGETFFRPSVTEAARGSIRSASLDFEAAELPEPLTAREIEVLRLIAAGMNNREIGEALGVAEGTVKNHTSSILSKLGVRDRTRAVLLAIQRGHL